MLNDIGESAGKLWHYLAENSPAPLRDAAKSLKLEEKVLAMAVGWLAREDKLDFQSEGKIIRLSLKSST